MVIFQSEFRVLQKRYWLKFKNKNIYVILKHNIILCDETKFEIQLLINHTSNLNVDICFGTHSVNLWILRPMNDVYNLYSFQMNDLSNHNLPVLCHITHYRTLIFILLWGLLIMKLLVKINVHVNKKSLVYYAAVAFWNILIRSDRKAVFNKPRTNILCKSEFSK